MSEDAQAIVAAILAAASAQTGRPWQDLRAEFEAIREELKPKLTPEQKKALEEQ